MWRTYEGPTVNVVQCQGLQVCQHCYAVQQLEVWFDACYLQTCELKSQIKADGILLVEASCKHQLLQMRRGCCEGQLHVYTCSRPQLQGC